MFLYKENVKNTFLFFTLKIPPFYYNIFMVNIPYSQ